jgi:hypothetical protein
MTDQPTTGRPARRTRRQLLAGGAGALAVVFTAEALTRPASAAAADGDNVILGQINTETDGTDIANSGNSGVALTSTINGSGFGVIGSTDSGDGVKGVARGDGTGVHGTTGSSSGSGVFGENTGHGNGVFGHAKNLSASGVYGQNDSTGFGVAGRAAAGVGVLGDSANGIGVWASSENATALTVTGTAKFSRSGILTVPAGKSSVTQTGVHLTSASLVLVTLQQDRPGVWVRSAVPNVTAQSFTVHLSKTVPARTRVAWFVVN